MPTPALDRGFFGFLLLFFRHLLDQAHGLLADLLDGKNLLHDQALRDHRLEFVEDDVDGVDLFAAVARDHALGQRGSLREFHFAENADMFAGDLRLLRHARSLAGSASIDSTSSARLFVCTFAAG